MTDLSLLQDFVAETVEHLEEMEGNLLQLERNPDDRGILNDIFRCVHTIKGAAEYLGLERIAELSHKLENLLDMLRHKACTANRDVIDLLMAARDRIGILTADLHQNRTEEADIDDLLDRIRSLRPEAEALPRVVADAAEGDSVPAAKPVIETPISETYMEEHDEELFGIFLEQLQEGLENLQSWTDALAESDDEDRSEILGRCLEQLDPLRSSANYMGYGRLAALYDAWHEALQNARDGHEGEDGFAAFLADHMQANIDAIGIAFPRLNLPGRAKGAPAGNAAEDTFSFLETLDDGTPGSRGAEPCPVALFEETETVLFPPQSAGSPPGELRLFPGEDLGSENSQFGEVRKDVLDLGLLQEFVAETAEHLAEMEDNLLQLEADPGNKETLNDIFRSVHTIKGAAEFMGMRRIAELSHKLENLLEKLRHSECTASRTVIDLLMAARDRIGILTADLHQNQVEQADIEDLLVRLDSLEKIGWGLPQEPHGAMAADAPAAAPETADLFPEKEIYEEEHDQELFGIFLEQLQEGLEALQSWTDTLSGTDRSEWIEILGRCLEQVARLRSSANYMGYRNLTGLYERWQEAIRTALERLQEEDDGFMPAFIVGCMQSTLDDIRRCFPLLDAAAAGAFPPSNAVSREGGTAGSGQAASTEADDLLDTYARTPESGMPSITQADPGEAAPPGGNLYDRLSRSFDCRMAESRMRSNDSDASGMERELFSSSRPIDCESPSSPAEPLATGRDASGETISQGASGDGATGEMTGALTEPPPPPDSGRAEKTQPAESSKIMDMAEAALATPDRAAHGGAPYPGPMPVSTESHEPPRAKAGSPATAEGTDDDQGPDVQPSSEETTAIPIDRAPGDRRDAVQGGRRQSDRIGERLLRQSIRVDAGKIDALMNQVGELVVSRAWFSQLFHEMRDLQQNLQHSTGIDPREMKQVKALTFRLSEATVALGRVANELQEGVMKVRMLPIAQLFNRYPRLVFDLVRDGNKKVKLDIRGEDTELDKMVIEAISDPLIHILRNAVDHGIEPVEDRKRLGKPESGTIHLEAYHEGNHVVIEIADDGRGLDPERIKSKAVAGGFATRDEIDRMGQKELTSLIMQPGFSTAIEVTHTSGRGVGMDVVKQNIEKLNGTIEIDSTPGLGTQFRIKIPLTLAIIPALLVQVCGELFTIPLSTVEETIRIAPQDLSTIEGVEVMQLRDGTLPLVRLAELFKMPKASSGDGRAFVVVVSTGMKRVGLVVDILRGQEEVVIKPLEDYLQEKSGFSGATILGDGRISLILDIYELVNLSIDRQARRNKATGTA